MTVRLLALLILLWLAPWPASAESLRCEGGSVTEGDSRLSLVYKCGEPALRDTRCAPVFFPGTLEVVPEEFALQVLPCVLEEAWLYERGPGELTATVILRGSRVRSILYGRVPR